MANGAFKLSTLTAALIHSPFPALAYIDPGAGSMLLQLLLGGSASIAVVLKIYWRQIASIFALGKAPKQVPAEDANNKTEE